MDFHQEFPRAFSPIECRSLSDPSSPVYFGNVCLRLIPAFDKMWTQLKMVKSALAVLDEGNGVTANAGMEWIRDHYKVIKASITTGTRPLLNCTATRPRPFSCDDESQCLGSLATGTPLQKVFF